MNNIISNASLYPDEAMVEDSLGGEESVIALSP
jgi:hypothetical protein